MKINYIEIKAGERHPLCFSLAATERIIDEFGGLEDMTTAIQSGSELQKLRAIDKVLAILMDAGRKYCSEMGIDMPPAIKCRPADLIDVTDGSAIEAIFRTMQGDTAREVEAKNADPAQ